MFFERGWFEFNEETQDEWDWNIWWRNSRFRTSDYDKILPWQRINHYPRSTMITKKDGLARNLKRMRGVYGANIYNFSPTAFNLPHDYTRFVTEYTKAKEKQKETGSKDDMYWICKPADMSRGRGIFVFKDLSELTYDCTAVVQRYISHPFLIGGYKFDLRIYVSVPSYHPLRIYIHEEGLVRFGTDKYDLNKLGNLFSHLTNTSINKHSPMYAADKDQIGSGCKWTLTQLRHYFRQENINDHTLWTKIINIVVLTLIIQHSQVPPAENCYELYGFDVIIDEHMKPWLLEVNFSPAMSCDSQVDIQVKKPMLHDVLDMLEFKAEDCKRGGKAHKRNMVNKSRTFDNDQFRYGRKYASANSKSGKLPAIPRMQSSGSSCTSTDRPFSSEVSDEESGSDLDPIPVLAGCGLPSVQQIPRRNCTACHHISSGRPLSNFEDWRTKAPASSPAKKHTISVDVARRNSSFNTLNISNACSSMEQLSLLDGSHQTSMSTGASYPRDEKSRLVFRDSDKTYQSMNIESINTGDANANNNHAGLRASRKLSVATSADTINGMSRERNAISQQPRRHCQEETRREDSAGNGNDSTDHKPPRKSSVAKGKPVPMSSLQRQNYQFSVNSRNNPKFVQRYGGFHLVFPFNVVTQKCAVASTLDLKTVVGEYHRALQQALQSRGKKSFTPLWSSLKQSEGTSTETT